MRSDVVSEDDVENDGKSWDDGLGTSGSHDLIPQVFGGVGSGVGIQMSHMSHLFTCCD